ncbi:sugar-binding transcriptional regulator [Buttiauxella sp. B2]|uniref:sugar-binding transcriptional regulator n=1 Tax=Buttiauxella sp. B2 TaxID=2587812 RepID=UPI001120C3A2|nr:sugar-binding transcriptional regulator [Buttiauxella sp. B2]TNV11103.1 sugar-binding transcriptional regulator [Buttiauxella sp. B2]
MKYTNTAHDTGDNIALRAAWLHFVGGMTQSDVAKKLGLPSVKTHRLIARMVAEGAVKVSIDGDIVACLELEEQLCQRFGLMECRIAPDLSETGLPLRALGQAGADYLISVLSQGKSGTIGIGHGRTLSAMIHYLPRLAAPEICFVSLLGCLTRNYALNPHDVMHRITEKTGAKAYMMPVPFFANNAEDRRVLLAQRGVDEVFRMARESTTKLVGIGTVTPDTQLVEVGMIDEKDMQAIAHNGGVGEILGHFVNSHGEVLSTPLTDRTLAVPLAFDHRDHLIALAGGEDKVVAIRAVLNSGMLHGLITDERTAISLLS